MPPRTYLRGQRRLQSTSRGPYKRLRSQGLYPAMSALSGYGAYKKKKSFYQKKSWSRGGLPGKGKAFGRWAGGGLGQMAGHALNAWGGGGLGTMANAALGRLTGYGDYSGVTETNGPPVVNNGGKSNIFRHREYIGDVISSATAGAFSISRFAINPGLVGTFPWLAPIANNYQEWIPRGIVFEFRPTSADALNSVNTALGTVVMASDYNVLNNDFVTKQQMENSEFAVSIKPSVGAIHPIECDMKQTPINKMYVRSAPLQGADLRFTDLANFYIATVGLQGTSVNVGELWVSYEIEMMKPILASGPGAPNSPKQGLWTSTTLSTLPNPFGNLVPAASNTINLYVFGTQLSVLNCAQGEEYMIIVNWNAITTGTWQWPTGAPMQIVSNATIINSAYNEWSPNQSATNILYGMLSIPIKVTSTGTVVFTTAFTTLLYSPYASVQIYQIGGF